MENNPTVTVLPIKIKGKTYTLHFGRRDYSDAEWSLGEALISKPGFVLQMQKFAADNEVPPMRSLEIFLFVGLQRYIKGKLLPEPQPQVVVNGKLVPGLPENPVLGFGFDELREYLEDVPTDELFGDLLQTGFGAGIANMPEPDPSKPQEDAPQPAVPLAAGNGGSGPGPSAATISA